MERGERGGSARYALVLSLVALLAVAGCGGDDSDGSAEQTKEPTATEQSAATEQPDIDGFLRDSAEAVDLDPSDARREERPAPCPGAAEDGVAIRFYFDEPSGERGVELLGDLRAFWAEQETVTEVGEVELDEGDPGTEPMGSLSGTATGGILLEGWWYPASQELVVGAATTCTG